MSSLRTEAYTILTPSSNAYVYQTDEVSGEVTYDGMPVWVGFDDNGTPYDITDDVPLGMVYNRETAIYEKLYDQFSENEDWIVTRINNYITIDIKDRRNRYANSMDIRLRSNYQRI